MREIQSSANSRTIPISDRAELIFGKSIAIKCHPVAKFRQTIGPIHTGTPVAGILRAPRQSVTDRENASSQCSERQWNAGPALDSGGGKAEFEVSAGFKAESFSMKERLRLIFHSKTARRSKVGTGSEVLPSQLSEKGLHAHRPQESRKQGN